MLHIFVALAACSLAQGLTRDKVSLIQARAGAPAAALDTDGAKFPPASVQEAAEEYGGAEGLCGYWGWQPRAPGAPTPRVFYGTVTGNNGQADMYELHFLEVSPFVSRIVAVDPKMTQRGHPRSPSLNMSLPGFRRFGEQLRHVELDSLTPGKTLQDLSAEERKVFLRPGKSPLNQDFVIEQWTRAQLAQGFKDARGNWELGDDDIVVVADSDEIPMRHALAALHLCEVPQFARAQKALSEGVPPEVACQGSVLHMRSQVYEYFADCPTKVPLWWHPNAAPAACLVRGPMDFEDVRTGWNWAGAPTKNLASRHLHNVGMPVEDIAYKYGHYVEPRAQGLDSGLDVETNQEMMWRGCDPAAPDIGPGQWHMALRPSNDFIRANNGRGYTGTHGQRDGLERPFAILKERPELAEKILWAQGGKRGNPFVGKPGGTNYFDH